MTKKKRIPFKRLGRSFVLPSQSLNSWPSILESLDAQIEFLQTDPNVYKDKGAPIDIEHIHLTIKKGGAIVSLYSLWWDSEKKPIVHLQLGSIRNDLGFGKEVEALLISKGFDGCTPPLSEFDECVDW